jgi:hypothetical protein
LKEAPSRDFFSQSAKIRFPNSFIAVQHNGALMPQKGKDLIIFFWVNFSKLPHEERRHIVLLDYDAKAEFKSGYGFAIKKINNQFLPEVYWKGSLADRGGWYIFPEIPLELKQWVMFAVSIRDEKLLGLHYARLFSFDSTRPGAVSLEEVLQTLKESNRDVLTEKINNSFYIQLYKLGGYSILEKDENVSPSSLLPYTDTPLLFGAPQNSEFRGKISSFGILFKKDLTRNFEEYLRLLSVNPGNLLSVELLKKENIKTHYFFSNPLESEYQNIAISRDKLR